MEAELRRKMNVIRNFHFFIQRHSAYENFEWVGEMGALVAQSPMIR